MIKKESMREGVDRWSIIDSHDFNTSSISLLSSKDLRFNSTQKGKVSSTHLNEERCFKNMTVVCEKSLNPDLQSAHFSIQADNRNNTQRKYIPKNVKGLIHPVESLPKQK